MLPGSAAALDFTFPSVAAACLIVALLLFGLRWWLLDCPQGLRRVITAAMFVIGFACGVSGFMANLERPYGNSVSRLQLFADAIHSSVQLVGFGIEAKESHGWRLGIARVLMPLATAQLVLAALLTRARQWLLRARLQFKRPDVLILGCGETGLRIARLFERLIDPARAETSTAAGRVRRTILGIDTTLTSSEARAFQERYWLLQAPLGSDEAVPGVGRGPLGGIVVCTGDERRDVAILKQVVAAHAPPPPIVVRVDSDNLPRSCQVDPVLSEAYRNGTIQFINPSRLDARLLFRGYPPHSFAPGRFRAGGPNRCHVAFFAAGEAVDALGSQAVRALVYDPSQPLRLTVLVEDSKAAARRFFARFPALTQSRAAWADDVYGKQLPLSRIGFFESRPDCIEAHALRRRHALQAVDVIYVLGRDDAETCLMSAEALKVAATIGDPRPAVVVCLRDLEVRQELLDTDLPVERRFFGLTSWAQPEGAASELAALLSRERMPRTQASDAAAERLWRAHGQDPPDKTWLSTPHDVKWWNRFAADHADIKLALLGLSASARATDIRLALRDANVRDWLARLEHRRYVCERMIDGWVARAGTKLNKYRLNPTLVAFDDLQTGEQSKDRTVVDDLVNLLED